MTDNSVFLPFTLPCGVTLKNRIAKSAMSDSLGDGLGNPTPAQIRLYERWAAGGVGVSIIGEVQGDPTAAEKPGNLVLGPLSDTSALTSLAQRGSANDTQLWLQLGHAGAMTHPPIGVPKGPSALNLPGLHCAALSLAEINAFPGMFAETARLAQDLGFGGVQIHAAHGFLLSQFLSPLFNRRTDKYGGPIINRMRLLLEVVDAVRATVAPSFPVALKLNSTDQLSGGFDASDALEVVRALNGTGLDLIDISGGTYFPGAKSASDAAGSGPYFADFAQRARQLTQIPLMVTGGIKTYQQAQHLVISGAADLVGVARAMVLEPTLPHHWKQTTPVDVTFPRFNAPPEGGITAWYTMRLTDLGHDQETDRIGNLAEIITTYEARDAQRARMWCQHFGIKS